MMNLRKASALLLVGMMLTMGLAAFTAPVLADTEVVSDKLEIQYDPMYMIDELIWFADPTGNNPYNLGEGDGVNDNTNTAASCTLRVVIENTDTDPVGDFYLNITDYDQSVFDFMDTVPSTAGVQVSYGPGTIPVGGTETCDFTFDVLATNIPLGWSSDTAIEISWDYVDNVGVDDTDVIGNTDGWIYLCSIFDNPANDPDEVLPDMQDENDDAEFEAGDMFEESEMDLHNYDGDDIDDLTCVVTEPGNGVTLSGGRNTCDIPGGVTAGVTVMTLYRTDVAPRTPPGEYWGTADVTYTRDESDLRVTENDLDVLWEVDFSFADDDPFEDGDLYSDYQCRATDVTITDDGEGNGTKQVDVVAPFDVYQQSTFSDKLITVEVTIQNNGNTPVYNAEFELDPAAWPNFRNPQFFWTSAGTLSYDGILLSGVDLAIGENITFVIQVIVVKEIPIGEHRLPILYRGFYFNDGSLGDATGFTAFNLGVDLEIIFSIFVEDTVLDVAVTAVAMAGGADKADITSEVITVTVHNNERYAFIDVLVTADFTGTPFYAPLIDTATLDWPLPADRNFLVDAQNANLYIPFAGWAADADMAVTFLVDTDPNMVPDRYPFAVQITAIIEETLEVVTTTVIVGAELNYVGYGAMPVITAFTAEDIIPGQAFDLVLTIENVGDDTMRDVWVSIPEDGTDEYDWDLEADFKEQFDWTGVFDNWFDVTGPIDIPDDMFYTVGDLDVDNIREIVEINLYMEGVYSDPGSTIQVIHIIDLAPGAQFQVTFEMFADKDLVNGKPYNVVVTVTGIDSEGVTVTRVQTLEVWSSLPGDSYNPVELDWFDAGVKLLGLVLFFIIVLAILLWVYNKFKGDPEDEEEDDFDFEDDEPASFEDPAPADKAPEELVQP